MTENKPEGPRPFGSIECPIYRVEDTETPYHVFFRLTDRHDWTWSLSAGDHHTAVRYIETHDMPSDCFIVVHTPNDTSPTISRDTAPFQSAMQNLREAESHTDEAQTVLEDYFDVEQASHEIDLAIAQLMDAREWCIHRINKERRHG